jgi:hypothetical protein
VGPSGQAGKRKGKGLGLVLGSISVGPAQLAQQGSARLADQLGLQLSRLARAVGWLGVQAGSVLGVAGSSWAVMILGLQWAGGLLLLRLLPLAGCLRSLRADRPGPSVGLRGIRRGGSGSGEAGGRACVRATVCVCGSRRVLGERPQRLGRDTNATSRPHRGVDAHGEAVA